MNYELKKEKGIITNPDPHSNLNCSYLFKYCISAKSQKVEFTALSEAFFFAETGQAMKNAFSAVKF